MKKFLFILITFSIFCIASYAKNRTDTIQQLQQRIEKLEAINIKLTTQINAVNVSIHINDKKQSATNDSINILRNTLVQTNVKLLKNADHLEAIIQETSDEAKIDLSKLRENVNGITFYWIIAALFGTLLSFLLFVWLRNQLNKEKIVLLDQIKKNFDSLRVEQLELDSHLIKLLDKQMQLMNEEKHESTVKAEEVDHSLALKVADEIIRIKKNLSNMDTETKGLKHLSASVERIKDNFKANGYDMVDMLNKPYDQGMKVSANFRPDENRKHGEQIITRVIKPQVNFKGVMIQAAQVEVSVGEK